MFYPPQQFSITNLLVLCFRSSGLGVISLSEAEDWPKTGRGQAEEFLGFKGL